MLMSLRWKLMSLHPRGGAAAAMLMSLRSKSEFGIGHIAFGHMGFGTLPPRQVMFP